MKKKLRFGIIGCSRIARSSIIPAIKTSKFSELTFIGSRSQKKAELFAKEFNCKNFGSYDDVLDSNIVDAVYISLPIGLHEKWTIKAAQADKHILCEKSSTTSYSSALRMVRACKNNEVRLMEGLMFRFHPSHTKVLEFIRARYLGQLFYFNGIYALPPISRQDIRFKKDLGGGVFNDAGCYPICASRLIFGKEPTAIIASFVIDKDSKVDTKVTAILKFNDGKFANLVVGYDLYYQSAYTVLGNNGFLKLSRAYNIPSDMKASLTINSTKGSKEIFIRPTNHFRLMMDDFSQEIMKISFCNFNFEEDLLKQALIMDAARKSGRTHKFVEITSIQ